MVWIGSSRWFPAQIADLDILKTIRIQVEAQLL
jgi:hypothetical protein